MTLLSPWTLALAAAIFIPPLLMLYMLRLRRRPHRVASTLLWRTAYEDLLANVPFQRLRWSVLLVLQAAAILLIAAALARPVAPSDSMLGGRTVVLIDVGASMQMIDAEGGATRLQRAVEAVDDLIVRLPTGSQMMIVTYAATPTIRSGYESNPAMLRAALRSIENAAGQTDETSDLAAALQVAEPFTRPAEDRDQPPAAILVLTDGHVLAARDRGRFEVAAAGVREIRIGSDSPPPNLGIVALDGRRRDDDPSTVELFVRLLWTGEEAIGVPVTIEVHEAFDATATDENASAMTVRRVVDIPGAEPDGGEAGSHTLIETIPAPEAAVVVVRHGRPDAFDLDDVAVLVMPPPRQLRLALVAPEGVADPFVHDLLVETDPQTLEVVAPHAWTEIEQPADRFDMVVFDRVDAAAWPQVPSLSFGGAVPGVTRVIPRPEELARGRRILGWNRMHPLLRHAEIGDLVFSGVSALDLPEDADPVALGPDGPIVAVIRHAGLRHVVVGFALVDSTLPILPGYPIFVQNALDLLAGEAGTVALAPRTGEPLRLRVRPDTTSVRIVDGDAVRTLTIASGSATVAIPAAQRVGIRRLESDPAGRFDLPGGVLPASLLSETESDLRPAAALELVATAIPPGGEGGGHAEWWPWAILAALGLLAVEWCVYLRRAGA